MAISNLMRFVLCTFFILATVVTSVMGGEKSRIPFRSFVLSQDRKYCLAAYGTKIALLDLKNDKVIRTINVAKVSFNCPIYSIALSSDHDKALTSFVGTRSEPGDPGRTVDLWDIPTGRLLKSFHNPLVEFQAVAFSHNDQKVLCASTAGLDVFLQCWDATDARSLWTNTFFEKRLVYDPKVFLFGITVIPLKHVEFQLVA